MKHKCDLRQKEAEHQTKKGQKKCEAGAKKRVEDRGRICRRRTSFSGSVSVTGKRSLVCCSHIQVLM